MKQEFNKPLRMTKDNEESFKKLKNVIFVIKNILMKIFEFEIIVILPVNTEAQPIKNAI